MKRTFSLILALVLCLSLCACNNSQEEELKAALTHGTWISADRDWTSEINDTWIKIYSDYSLVFFEYGSYRGEYTETSIGAFEGTETCTYTGTWLIEDGAIILDRGQPFSSEKRYTLENGILYGPAADGYTYYNGN